MKEICSDNGLVRGALGVRCMEAPIMCATALRSLAMGGPLCT